MNREKMSINILRDEILKDPKTVELLELLEDFETFIASESDEDRRSFRLPYSSDPNPIGERWKVA